MPDRKSPNDYPQITFRVGKELDMALSQRTRESDSKHRIVKRDLERYYAVLSQNLPVFTESEAMLLCDALNGVACKPYTLWGNIASAIEMDRIDAKWEIDAKVFLARLKAFSFAEKQAIIDAVERAWNASEYHVDLSERIRVVGLVREENGTDE